MSFNWRQPAAATASSQQQAYCVSVVLGFDLDLGLVLYVVREGHCRLGRHTCLSYWKLIFLLQIHISVAFCLFLLSYFWGELAENLIVLLILFFLKKYNHFRVVSLIKICLSWRLALSVGDLWRITNKSTQRAQTPPRRKCPPKVIRNSNLDFRIDPEPDPNVCRIDPKMLVWIVALSASVISPSFVYIGGWCIRNCKKNPLFRSGEK